MNAAALILIPYKLIPDPHHLLKGFVMADDSWFISLQSQIYCFSSQSCCFLKAQALLNGLNRCILSCFHSLLLRLRIPHDELVVVLLQGIHLLFSQGLSGCFIVGVLVHRIPEWFRHLMTLLLDSGLLLFRVLIAFANKAYVASSALNIAILNLLLIEFIQLP